MSRKPAAFSQQPRGHCNPTIPPVELLHPKTLFRMTVSGLYSRSRGKCQVLPTHPPFGHTSPAAPGAHRLAGLLHKLLIPWARALPAKMLKPLAPHSIWSVSVCARVPLSHSYAPLPRVGVRATGYALRSSRPATAEVNPRRAAAR